MSEQTKKIDFINIDCDSNFFDTAEQVRLENTHFFVDRSIVSKISGSSLTTGYFSNNKVTRKRSTATDSLYPVSSIVIDGSGNSRKILSLDIDIFASSSIDSYKNGVEILRDKEWTAGLVKITAGTQGHLYDSQRYGIINASATDSLYLANEIADDFSGSPRRYLGGEWKTTTQIDASGNPRLVYATQRPTDRFVEKSKFDPVFFITTGGNSELFSFPVTTKISKLSESLVLDGVIEPLTIRPIKQITIKSNQDPHSIKSYFGSGNVNRRGASDSILSVDYFSPSVANKAVFLDTPGKLSNSTNITGSFPAYSEDYSTDENYVAPFEDAFYPRGESLSSTYDDAIVAVVNAFDPGGTTYVTRNQKSATCGFVFGDTIVGTDSITFGDMSYAKANRDNRRRKRTILSLRDSESFIKPRTSFDDTNTIYIMSQSIEYPSMAPVGYNGSLMNATVQSEVYKAGAIQVYVSGSLKPGNFDAVLYDSVISAKRRLAL